MVEWINLADLGFPDYAVSTLGTVRNERTGRDMHPSTNQSGAYKIGMMHATLNKQVTLSVAPIVAHAFLEPPTNERFNTPINVNGVRGDNRACNLMWRPRWFAIKYHKQFLNDLRGFSVPIYEIHTNEQFETSWEAAIKYGLLDREIAIATLNRTYVFPTSQEFRVVED